MTDQLSHAFETCLLGVQLPANALQPEELASLNPEGLLRRINGPQRTTAYYDERLVCYVTLTLPESFKVNPDLANALLESNTFVPSIQLAYLQHTGKPTHHTGTLPRTHHGQPQLSRQNFGLTAIPNSDLSPPTTPRGPAISAPKAHPARTPGFPFTPTPIPSHPDNEADDPYRDHATGPVIAEGMFSLDKQDKWLFTDQNGVLVLIWRIQCGDLGT